MKKSLFLSLAALLIGCATNDAPIDGATTVIDGIGREVSVKTSNIKNVVCVGAGALRVYSYVGDMNLLSGVEDIDNPDKTNNFIGVARPYFMSYGDLLKTLPSCGKGGPGAQAPEYINLNACHPDLIISEYENAKIAQEMEEKTGAKVFTVVIGKEACFDATFAKTITSLGKLLGKESKAKDIVDYINDAKSDIQNRTKDIQEESRPSVYLCGLAMWGMGGYEYTSANYPLFKVANIKNVLQPEDLVADTTQIKKEAWVSKGSDMDIMILDAASIGKIKTQYAGDHELFADCKAVQDGKVYLQMAYNAYYTNIEISLMDAYFEAASVYPDQFSDVDLTAKCNEITTLFNGKALYSEIAAISGSFGGYQQISNLVEFLQS